jgi:hypothetical protein
MSESPVDDLFEEESDESGGDEPNRTPISEQEEVKSQSPDEDKEGMENTGRDESSETSETNQSSDEDATKEKRMFDANPASVNKESVYVDEEVWNSFGTYLFDVEKYLHREHGLNTSATRPRKRELHTAFIAACIDEVDPEVVGEKLIQLRQERS